MTFLDAISDIDRCIRAVAVWEGDYAPLYAQWFADLAQESVVSQVSRYLLSKGIHRIDRDTFAVVWNFFAVMSGRTKTTFLPHHFEITAKARYGTSSTTDDQGRRIRIAKTQYPPYVLSDDRQFLDLNPIVAKAVQYVAEERGMQSMAFE